MTNPSLSITIMAHPKRYGFIHNRILPKINTHCCSLQTHFDTLSNGVWWNGRLSWLRSDKACTHHMVLQDDAILCLDFVETCLKIIEQLPNHPIYLYSGSNLVTAAQARNEHWATMKGGVWGIAIIMPIAWGPQFVQWADAHVNPDLKTYDGRLGMWLSKQNKNAWVCVPNLVEHDGTTTLLKHHNVSKSALFIGENVSGLTIDWSPPVKPLHRTFSLDPCWNSYHD